MDDPLCQIEHKVMNSLYKIHQFSLNDCWSKLLWRMFYNFFNPTDSATVYGRRPKFFRAKYLATAEGENCAYGPTLV